MLSEKTIYSIQFPAVILESLLSLKPGFHMVVMVVKIESRSFPPAEIRHFRTENAQSNYNYRKYDACDVTLSVYPHLNKSQHYFRTISEGFHPISRYFSYNTRSFICCLYHYYVSSPKSLNQYD